MRPNQMHQVARKGCHDCAPGPWKKVPNVTGDYDLDATILHRRNPDMAHRLNQHIARAGGGNYVHRTMSSGNHGNHGDD